MSEIKAPANWGVDIMNIVNTIKIEGARLPLQEGAESTLDERGRVTQGPFSDEEMNGVSGWALLYSIERDDEWDISIDTEVPEKLKWQTMTISELDAALEADEDFDMYDKAWIAWTIMISKMVEQLDIHLAGGDVDFDFAKPESGRDSGWRPALQRNFGRRNIEAGGFGGMLEMVDNGESIGDFRFSNSFCRRGEYFPQGTAGGYTGTNSGYGFDFFSLRGDEDSGSRGYWDWARDDFSESSYNDGHAEDLPMSTAMKCPYMGDGVVGQSVAGYTLNELKAQIEADVAFLRKRRDAVQARIMAYAIISESDEFDDDAMDRIKELQEEAEDRDLTSAESEELTTLMSGINREGLTQRAEQQQRLNELRENGEAGEFAAAMRAQEQCFLIADIVNMSKLNIAAKKEYRVSGGPAAHMVHGEIGAMVSTLMFDPAYSAYYFMTPDKLSYLTPSIKLYQVLHEYYPTIGGEEAPLAPPVDFEIPFFQHITQNALQDIMTGEEGRGGGVAIKNFDWVYQGSNPANSRRDIKATLVLECQNFSDLTKDRTVTLKDDSGNDFTHNWMYADLAIRRNRDHQQAPDVLYSQLKVVVGWGLKELASEGDTMGFTADEVSAIKNSQMTMFLTIIDHSFDIRDDGTVQFKIEYRAYIEGAFTSPEASVLVTPELLASQQERVEAMAALQEELADPAGQCRPEDMAEMRRRFTQAIQREKEQAHMALLRKLEGETPSESRIYTRRTDIVDMMNFMDNPFAGMQAAEAGNENTALPNGTSTPTRTDHQSLGNYLDTIEASMNFPSTVDFNNQESANVNEMMESIYTADEDGVLQIPYFFLGDLIHVALENIALADSDDPKKFDQTRLLLGPIEINSFTDPDVKYQINLADIPIAVTYFLEWFLNRIQAKQEVTWYLVDFIKDIIKNLVYKTLNSDDCFQGAIRQQANFQNLYLVGSDTSNSGVDPVQRLIDAPAGNLTRTWKRLFVPEVAGTGTDIPILSVDRSDEPIPSNQQYNYILLYAADPQPSHLDGDFQKDLGKGIYHFHIGTNKGLVKRIKFTKTDQPYMREARYMNQGYDGLSQLREPYKIDVEMYGNARIFPGMTVYIDPRGLGYELGQPSDEGSKAWTLGLGGYHMVINAQHSIARGVFDTRINCVWVLRGSAGGESTQADGAETPARNTQNCEPLNNYGEPSGYTPSSES